MRNLKSLISILLVMLLVIISPVFGLADKEKDNDVKGKGKIFEQLKKDNDGELDGDNVAEEDKDEEDDENDEDSIEDEEEKDVKEKENFRGKGKGLEKAWKEEKDKLEKEKDAIEEQKDQLEEQKEILEEEYEKAVESGNLELAEQIKQQIQEIKTEMDSVKEEIKQIKERMKEIIRNKYTEEELEKLKQVAEELENEHEGITVLPVENIITKGIELKFDIPPVIKEGRTLIPVRAISEGFGAEVLWNQEEQKVTIIKDGKEIILQIGSKVAYVDGVEVEIDTYPEILNNRTIVPLRFIAETLGLIVEWDGETETIEIDEESVETELEEDTQQIQDTEQTTDDVQDINNTQETDNI